MTIPVHIIGGFLGTGKTTFIRDQLAARKDEQLAILVNDFGEASLDAATLAADRPYEITNIPGGCVCCTAPEGFVDALGEIVARGPDRLLIEPTGLARPQDLIDTIRRSPHADSLEIAPVIVLIDPARLARAGAPERELIAHQAEIADVLVANRTDLCEPEALEHFETWAAELWPGPLVLHRTTHGRVPVELMEWPENEGTRLSRVAGGHRHQDHAADDSHDHHADSTEGFRAESWRWSAERVFSRERLFRAVLRMSQGLTGAPLARFKGIFHTDEGFLLLELAGGAVHEARSLHRRDSRADAIFTVEGDTDPARLAAIWLSDAVLSDRELEAKTHEIELALPDGRVRIIHRKELLGLPDGIPDVSLKFAKRAGAAARIEALWQAHDLPGSGHAILCAADGFTSEPVPIEALRQGVLLHTLDGEALPAAKGGPFRLLIPEEVENAPSACANVKGVVRIVLKKDTAE
ncbi:MAG: GTP-binding protein [Deltaproteobacteria bacterium]|nr:GTP-binding protein [Deltaproteobacteria bacterium]MBW2396215.1 GTP-binding protein [Deltaproteobacteria bacterium]